MINWVNSSRAGLIGLIYFWTFVCAPIASYAQQYRGKQISASSLYMQIPFSTKLYVVKKGDTLSAIGRKYNVSVKGLLRLNEGKVSSPHYLKIGATLVVPSRRLSQHVSRQFDQMVAQNAFTATMASGAQRMAQGTSGTIVAKEMIVDEANNAISTWLNQYGTARVHVDVTDKFKFGNADLDMLLPLWDRGNTLFFAQAGVHRGSDRTQGNIGLGGRYFTPSFMVGANGFFDYDFTGKHSRAGAGVEVWRDYLKLAANGYFRVSDWKHVTESDVTTDNDLTRIDARPANGWDVNMDAYLPFFPQLGLNVNYAKYYGNVALIEKDAKSKDPYAVTLGLSYTPVPLLTVAVDYKRDNLKKSNTHIGLDATYRFGVPLSEQLDPSNVASLRTLAGSRYDLVSRNNDIVLEYKALLSVVLKSDIKGQAEEEVLLFSDATLNDDWKIADKGAWTSTPTITTLDDLLSSDCKKASKLASCTLTLPAFDKSAAPKNTYKLNFTLTNKKDSAKNHTFKTNVTVLTPVAKTFVFTDEVSQAAFGTTSKLKVKITDEVGDPFPGLAKYLKGTATAKALTASKTTELAKVGEFRELTDDDKGTYEATFTAGNQENTYTVSVSYGGTEKVSKEIVVYDKSKAPSADNSRFYADPAGVDWGSNANSILTFVAKNHEDTPGDSMPGIASKLRFDVFNELGKPVEEGMGKIIENSYKEGQYEAEFKPVAGGKYTIKAMYNTGKGFVCINEIPVNFRIQDEKPTKNSTLTLSSVLVHKNVSVTFTLNALSAGGSAIHNIPVNGGPGYALQFIITPGDIKVTNVRNDQNGKYRAEHALATAGVYKIMPQYRVGDNNWENIFDKGQTLTVAEDGIKPDAVKSKLTGPTSDVEAGVNATLTLAANSGTSLPISDLQNKLQFKVSKDSSDAGTLTFTEGSEGIGTYTATFNKKAAGTYTVRVQYQKGPNWEDIGISKEITVKLTERTPDVGKSTIDVPAEPKAGRNITLTFKAKNKNDAPLPGLAGDLTPSFEIKPPNAAAELSPFTAGTAPGTYKASFTPDIAGPYTVKVTYSKDGKTVEFTKAFTVAPAFKK